ncbi:MAG TPA: DUF3073 domain-containing protein [Micromonospora sp.]
MGRGRAKAKQTKVARELKYNAPKTDLTALQRELAGSRKSNREFDDPYADYYVDDDDNADDDDQGEWASRR